MSKCPHCGAEVQYKPDTKKVHCEYCGSDFKVSELLQEAKKAKEREIEDSKPQISGKAYSCTQCGATLLSFDETAVTFCSYCGSQNMIEEKTMQQTAPEVIIPFAKTQDECIRNYKRKISHFIFSPNYMKSDLVVKKFRGIYMPYGIYNLSYNGDTINRGKKYNHRSGDYVYYDDYDIHAQVDASYNGISFDLLSKFYDEYSHAIPFDYHGAEEFNVNYLPGFYADSKDVEIGTYSPEAIQIAASDSTRYLRRKHIYAKYQCYSPIVNFHVGEKKVGFFPVYFAAIRDKDDKHLHYAIINGQTGEVAADMPIDFAKYIIFSLVLAIPIFFFVNFIPIVLPWVVNLFTIFMAIVAWIICATQISACNDRYNRINDKGFNQVMVEKDENGRFKRKKPEKQYKVKFSYWSKYLAAILLSFGTIVLNPVSDMFYYGSAVIGLVLILFSFFDLVKIHNILVSRPIPQLEKRGGDESE